MIRVKKPMAPVELKKGACRTERDCNSYNTSKSDYLNGRKKFEFDGNIYGHKTVRSMLREAQHSKCCYCEGHFVAFSPGDVEHYRPKGAVRQDTESKELNPGYYWLAYSWTNLYWCCPVCNRSHKKDLFPIVNPEERARSHGDNIDVEKPLIVDPGGWDDPEFHIGFDDDLAVGKSKAGRTTIDVAGLNRPDLQEERRVRLNRVRKLHNVIQAAESGKYDKNEGQSALNQLQKLTKPTARFSAMTKAFVKNQLPAKAIKEILG